MTHDLRHHHRTRTLKVEVCAGELDGAATSRITVMCDGQTYQFDTDQLAGVHVRAEDDNNTIRLNIEGPGTQGIIKTATQTARVKVNSTASASSGENAKVTINLQGTSSTVTDQDREGGR